VSPFSLQIAYPPEGLDDVLLKLRTNNIPADRPWNAFSPQRAFAWQGSAGAMRVFGPGSWRASGFRWLKRRDDIQLPVTFES
jgi:hypothetical protein